MGNLDQHVDAIHKGKKKFNCDMCIAEFTPKQRMNGHIETIHEEGKKQFKCDICVAIVGQSRKLNKHVYW